MVNQLTDEKFVFVSELREKKTVARSSRHKRTHCGKGGAVKFPSDYLSKKELSALSGEVKAYRLNSPMSWAEFKSMPDDIQISYVKMIRKRYGVSDSKIAKMLGVGQKRFSEKMQELGIGLGRHAGHAGADKEGFLAWCNTIPLPISSDEEILEEVAEASEEVMEANTEDVCEHIPVINELSICAIPSSGSLTFTGSAEAALKTVSVLLGGGKCHYKYFVGSTVGTQKGCGYLWLM